MHGRWKNVKFFTKLKQLIQKLNNGLWKVNYNVPSSPHFRHFLSWNFFPSFIIQSVTSSSIGTATLVGFGLLNYRWVFSAERFLQSAVASGTSNPQLGGPVIRTFQFSLQGIPRVWNDASEAQQRKVELWARNFREFCRKWRFPRHFWDRLHAVNLLHGTDGFTSPPKEGALRIFFARKIRRFRPGLNPRTWVPEASTLTSRPPKTLQSVHYKTTSTTFVVEPKILHYFHG